MKEIIEDICLYVSPFTFMAGTYMTLRTVTDTQIAQSNPLYVFATLAIDLFNLAYFSHLLRTSIKGYLEFNSTRKPIL